MPNAKPVYVVAMYGLPGCLADSFVGPVEFRKRSEFVQFVNSTLRDYDYSDRARRQVNLMRFWCAQQNGARYPDSFIIENTQPGAMDRIEFRALSREEFETMEQESF